MEDIILSQEQIQAICDKWAELFHIGSWQFTVELKDNGPSLFRYNCQNGMVVLEIPYPDATEKTVVSMLVDFSLLHKLLPCSMDICRGEEQYVDHDDRNIGSIVDAFLFLQRGMSHDTGTTNHI